MWNWENKVVFNYIYYSRFIASWVKVNTKKKNLHTSMKNLKIGFEV